MIKVVSFKICPFVQRVLALLEAKAIPYEIEYISLKEKPEWFLKISPTGQVPLLITERETVLFESDAIIEYLEEEYKPLQEISNECKALNRAWSYLGTKNYLLQCSMQRSTNKEIFQERKEKLDKVLDRIEKVLGNTKFFNSDSVSVVDIAWLPLLHRMDIINEKVCYDFLQSFPKMKKWQENLKATGLFEKSVASDFTEKFSDFYLSKETYLGNNMQDCDCKNLDCC